MLYARLQLVDVYLRLAKGECVLKRRVNWEAVEDADKLEYEPVLRDLDRDERQKLAYHNTRGGRATTGGRGSQTGSVRVGSTGRLHYTSQIGSTRGSSQW